MKNIKRNILILVCIGIMALLTACSSMKPLPVDTKLQMDKSFNGQRIMTAVMPNKEFKALFDGDLEKLKSLLSESCPKNMYSTAQIKDNKDVEITLTIPFASYNEYYDKIMKIFSGSSSYDANNMPSVYFEYSDSLLKKGFTVEENFASTELFFWLIDAFIEKVPQLSDKKAEELFTQGATAVEFDGQAYESDDCINISQMDSNALDHIDVETTLNSTGTYDVIIDYYVGNAIVEKLGTKLNVMMNDHLPEGGVFSTKSTEDGKVFTIKVNAINVDDYVTKLNKALHTDNTVFEVLEESDELDTLKARKKITQYLDGSYFLDFTNENTTMTYILKASAEHSFENCESANKYIQSYNFENTEEYCGTYITVRPSDKITLSLGYSVDIDKIEVDTTMINEKNFVRVLKFTLTSEQNNIIGERFEERIKTRLADHIVYEKTASGTSTVYNVTLTSDSVPNLSLLTVAFLDGNETTGNSKLDGGLSNQQKLKKIRYEFTDKINFMTFLSGSQSTKGLYYRFQYPKNFTAHFSDNNNCENILEDYNVLTCITHNKVIEVKSFAEKANVMGILQQVMWLLSLAGMLIVVLLNFGGIMRCIKKKQFDLAEFDMFTQKGYAFATILTICIVIFVIATIRLLFKIY